MYTDFTRVRARTWQRPFDSLFWVTGGFPAVSNRRSECACCGAASHRRHWAQPSWRYPPRCARLTNLTPGSDPLADRSGAGGRDSTDAWDRLWSVFHEAVECPAEQRDTFLDEACRDKPGLRRQVRELLDAHIGADGDLLSQPPSFLIGEQANELDGDPRPGDLIGSYRLEALIGEGGMGLVYRAQQQAPIRRQVALKILQLGMATRDVMTRFEAERQALALMSHSNIAKVYDAGATPSGRPYFVMEYVDGVPITEYCDTQRLSIRERLQLFLGVCDGVQHAHQKGVIHRDIKPSNVLVAKENREPVPKIIDFGIAKATQQSLTQQTLHTRMGAIIGTPAYMSPEQAGVTGQDVDTRTDVYSLGVLLYELLVGVGPFESMTGHCGLPDMQRLIRDEEPQRPAVRLANVPVDALAVLSKSRGTQARSLLREIGGDFGWIALKAMEKDRERRYLTVSELAADIRRYLSGLPVEAHAHTAWYRTVKFARRHTVGVALTALLVLLGVLFAAFMTMQTVRLQNALTETTRQRNRAQQVSNFMVQLFSAANPNQAQGKSITVREMLDEGAETLKDELKDQPQLRATLLATIAGSYRVLGEYQEANRLLEQALDDMKHLPVLPERDAAVVFNDLGEVQHDLGNYDDAERYYRRALNFYDQDSENASREFAEVLANLSDLYRDRGMLSEAEVFATRSVTVGRRGYGERSAEVARLMQRLGYVLQLRGEHERAQAIMRDQLDVVRAVYGDEHPFTASALNYYGIARRAAGDARGAQASLQEAAAIYRKTHGEDHLYLASTLSNLGLAYSEDGQLPEAEAALRESIRIGSNNFAADNPSLNSFRISLGNTLVAMGRWAEAEQLLRFGLQNDRKNLDPVSPFLLATLDRLAALLDDLGKHEEAEALLLEALDTRREVLGENHSDTGVSHHRLAMNLLARELLDIAEQHSRRAVEIHRGVAAGDEDWARLASSMQGLGRVLQHSGDPAGAEVLYRDARAAFERDPGEQRLNLARLEYRSGELAEATGNNRVAEQTYARVAAELRELLPAGHPDVAWADVAWGRTRCRNTAGSDGWQRVADARVALQAALGADNWQLAVVDAAAGECAARGEDFAAAEQALLQSYATVRASRGDRHYLTRELSAHLVDLYQRWKRPDSARRFQADLELK